MNVSTPHKSVVALEVSFSELYKFKTSWGAAVMFKIQASIIFSTLTLLSFGSAITMAGDLAAVAHESLVSTSASV